LTNSLAIDVFTKCCPLLLHPSAVIRKAVIKLVAITSSFVGQIDSYVFLMPLMRSALKYDLVGFEITEQTVEKALLAPLPRTAYRKELHSKLSQSGSGGASAGAALPASLTLAAGIPLFFA
jgi:hypothetical protein